MISRVANIVNESERLVDAAQGQGLRLRLLGGIGIYLRSPDAIARPELVREYADIDLAGQKKASKPIRDFLTAQGYEPNPRFNALHGSERLLFYDMEHERQVDVFLGAFKMCHELDLEPRIALEGPALTPSDLLLLKLQIVHLNEKDVRDSIVLLLQYPPVVEDTPETLSTDYICEVCAKDWGWYTTFQDNLATLRTLVPQTLRIAEDVQTVQSRIDALSVAVEAAPKSLSWRLRDKVGRRKVWYELPDEVAR